MSPMGVISRKPQQSFRRLVFFQGFWAIVSIGLVFWWGSIILSRQEMILALELKLGEPNELAQAKMLATRTMILSEGSVFVFLIIASFALYWILFIRDQKRSRSIQSFFASMTHELKTPLTSIRLQAEALSDQVNNPLIQRLLDDTHRLEGQLERSLELARIEGGGSVHLQGLRLESLFSRLKDQVGAFGKDRIELVVTGCNDCVVFADPTGLYTIFRNLFENSVRHSGKKNVLIDVSCRRLNSNYIEVTVKDSGKGFHGNLRKIGQLFNKGPESQGAGVGLYLVRALVRRMDGECSFESDSSGFIVRLLFKSEIVTE